MAAVASPGRETGSAAVREELERILASQMFRTAEAQKKFLHFVVEQVLEGRPHQIKEFAIGSDVFARGSSFDPRIDNIVRVEARKLRIRLARYYETEGTEDPIRIVLPQRGYVPAFEAGKRAVREPAALPKNLTPEKIEPAPLKPAALADQPNHPRTPLSARIAAHRIATAGAVLSVAVLAALIVTYAVRGKQFPRTGRPSIAVLPFRNLGDLADDSFSDGLTDDLIDSLGSVPGLRVVARSSTFQFKGGGADIH